MGASKLHKLKRTNDPGERDGKPITPPHPVGGQTNMTENITFPRLSYVVGNKEFTHRQ